MNVGLYQGAASLAALQRMQSAISENISCASIAGYQKTEVSFDGVLGESTRLGDGASVSKELGASMPQLTSRISRQQGSLKPTGSDLDFAINGRGYFQVQRPDGSTGYTRNGEFHLTPDRTLVTREGLPVLGDSGPLTFRPEGGHVSITADGQIVQGEVPVGKIGVVDFPDEQPLKRIGDGLLGASNGEPPRAIEQPSLINGSIEESNVVSMQEMVNLITVSRAYEASQKVVTAADEAQEKSIQILGNPNS